MHYVVPSEREISGPVKEQLAKGADVNTWDSEFGVTALSWAALLGHTEIAELLIGKGADVNAKEIKTAAQRCMGLLFSGTPRLLNYSSRMTWRSMLEMIRAKPHLMSRR